MHKSKRINISMTIISLLRYVLIIGFCYVILKPIIQYFFYACMSQDDFSDYTVSLIPRHWSLFYFKKANEFMNFFGATGIRSLSLAFTTAILQVVSSTVIGYGLGRFEFKGKKILVVALFAVMLIPPSVLQLPQYFQFRFFGFGSFKINLINTLASNYILSFVGLGLKQALYIFLMKLMFEQLPIDLENAAYIDGASIYRTFVSVIVPNAKSLMITIFMFSFCWTWTDTTFSAAFYPNVQLVANSITKMSRAMVVSGYSEGNVSYAGIMLMMLPMLILMSFCQKKLVKSIALSGLAN